MHYSVETHDIIIQITPIDEIHRQNVRVGDLNTRHIRVYKVMDEKHCMSEPHSAFVVAPLSNSKIPIL
jgi:hypothetical protein